MENTEIFKKVEKIKCIISDNDGVFTDGKFSMLDDGKELYTFDTRDGLAVKIWLQIFGEDSFIIVTGRDSGAVKYRAKQLGIKHVFTGIKNKMEKVEEIARVLGLEMTEIAILGDDIQDLGMLRLAGYSAAPADAQQEVLNLVDYVSRCCGGNQAVRDIIKGILTTQGKWKHAVEQKSF